MSDQFALQAVLDATTMTKLLYAAEKEASQLGLPPPQAGTKALGPFTVTWDVSASLQEQSGEMVFKHPGAFGLKDVKLNYAFKGKFSVDLNTFKPLLGASSDLPTVPMALDIHNTLPVSGEVALHPRQNADGSEWLIDAQAVDPLKLPLEEATAFAAHIGEALTAELKKIPVLSNIEDVVKAILQPLGTEQVQHFLQSLLQPFVSGFTLYHLPTFITFAARLPVPLQAGVQIDMQTTNLAVTPRIEQQSLCLTWTGLVLLKLLEADFTLRVSGENAMQVYAPDKKLEEQVAAHLTHHHEVKLTCDVVLSTS